MTLSDFSYQLPKELIAQRPLARGNSRLMVIDRIKNKIYHYKFIRVTEFLNAGDLLVLNDTKVIPARIFGRKKDTQGKVDALLSRRISNRKYEALLDPPLKMEQEVIFGAGLKAKHIAHKILVFNKPITKPILHKIGHMPLPPYIKRMPQASDKKDYQTVFARNPGAIASPTAGLHFTNKILRDIKRKAVNIAYVTLHVGLGTFKPLNCENILRHEMDKEEFFVPEKTLIKINKTRKIKNRVFACGTTAARALESISEPTLNKGLRLKAAENKNWTGLFIYPGYKFKVVDCLLTNFHLPRTTLFMLVCAFAGRDLIMRAYQQAIERKYRFYSYGDAMLIV